MKTITMMLKKMVVPTIMVIGMLACFAGIAQAATAVAFSPVASTLFIGAGVFGGMLLLGALGMALTANASRTYELADINELPVKALTKIYEGAAVGDDGSGYARGLVSGDPFRGFAEAQADNSAGLVGAINVRVLTKGKIYLAVTSAEITDVGRPVYASADGTFALDGIGTFIGYVYRYVASGYAIVTFDATVPERETVIEIPITNAKLADGDVVTTFTPGFNGRYKGAVYITHDPVTTGSKASTLNLEIGTTNVTGGTIALTSATMTPIGKVIASAAITAGAAFTATDTISLVAASTTTFIEGTGVVRVRLGM